MSVGKKLVGIQDGKMQVTFGSKDPKSGRTSHQDDKKLPSK